MCGDSPRVRGGTHRVGRTVPVREALYAWRGNEPVLGCWSSGRACDVAAVGCGRGREAWPCQRGAWLHDESRVAPGWRHVGDVLRRVAHGCFAVVPWARSRGARSGRGGGGLPRRAFYRCPSWEGARLPCVPAVGSVAAREQLVAPRPRCVRCSARARLVVLARPNLETAQCISTK